MDSSDLPFQPAPGASSEATPGPSRTQAHHDDSDEEVQIPVLHRSDVVQDASTIAPHAIDEAFANQELFPLLATRAGVQDEYPEASEELWKESVETANLLAAALRESEHDPDFVTKYKNAMNGNASDMFFETLADQDSDFAINLVALLRSKDPNLTLGDDLSPSPPPEPSNAGPAQNEVDMITGFGSLESWVQTFGEDAREHYYDVFPEAAAAVHPQPSHQAQQSFQAPQAPPMEPAPPVPAPAPARPLGAAEYQLIQDIQANLPPVDYNNIKAKLQQAAAYIHDGRGNEAYSILLQVHNDLYTFLPVHQFPARLSACLQNRTWFELAENF